MNLRDYQIKSIDEIRQNFKLGNKKVLLWLATGAGKTVVFSYILNEMAKRGKKAAMIVRGRQLVDQASKRLFRENVRHGVRMASHWNKDFSAPIQICSVDTLTSRGEKFFPEADLIVIDEVHMATSKAYKKIIDHYHGKFVLGVTATPWAKDGLSHAADVVIHPITMTDLTLQGFLVPAKYFAPSNPDLRGVGVHAGDFVNKQIKQKMDTLTGNIVETWKKIGENRPTLLFACNIEHSKQLQRQFLENGIAAEHIEADDSLEKRDSAVEKLSKGDLKIICNVGTMCTGVDIPQVSCLILARPTKSYSLYVQQIGRGTRPFEGKSDFLILDHAGNALRHGFVEDEPQVDLDFVPDNKSLGVKRCLTCFTVYIGLWCPDCGPKDSDVERSKEIIVVEGELKELVGLSNTIKISRRFEELKRIRKQKQYKRAWIYFQLRNEFGDEIAQKIMPKRIIPPWVIGRT